MNDSSDIAARPTERARELARGITRFLTERGEGCLPEFTLAKNGRRADLIALDGKGRITIVEIKSSIADFRADRKWQDYLDFCDRFFFAVGDDFPLDLLPSECGIILADAWGAAVHREAPVSILNAARRKAVTLRYARAAAVRLVTFTDPDWVRI